MKPTVFYKELIVEFISALLAHLSNFHSEFLRLLQPVSAARYRSRNQGMNLRYIRVVKRRS